MRHRSPTNSRPWECRELYYEYLLNNPVDEISKYFPGDSSNAEIPHQGGKTHISRHNATANQRHHITGGIFGAARWDRIWNLVAVGPYTHRFCESYTFDGVVLCVHHKMAKGEWMNEHATETLGWDVLGYLETKKPQHFFVRKYLDAVLNGEPLSRNYW